MKTKHGRNGSLTPDDQRAIQGILDEVRDEYVRAATDVGWTPEHDDTHEVAFMIDLATERLARARNDAQSWPSDARVSEARDNLVKAANLLVATIARLDREASHG